MANDVTSYLYPEDDTGLATTNLVVGEKQTLNPPLEDLDFHFILPMATPYFRDSMVLTHITTGQPLIRGVDWAPGHAFESASFELENIQGGVYSSILFYDRTLSGQVGLQYQTLGGTWTLSENTIFEILANRAIDPRSVTYEEVSGKPTVFPPTDHDHPADDFTGVAELIAAQYAVAAAIRDQTNSFLTNPPVLFSLYYLATEIDAMFLALSNKLGNYYTSAEIDQKLAGLISGTTPVDGYTKDQINTLLANLGNNFANYYTSAQIDTMDGAINAVIAALTARETAVEQGLATHIAAQGNVHSLTPAELGAVDVTSYATDKAAMNQLINTKLNASAQAVDSAKLGGKTETQVLADAYAQVGTMGKRALFSGAGAPSAALGVVGDIYFQTS